MNKKVLITIAILAVLGLIAAIFLLRPDTGPGGITNDPGSFFPIGGQSDSPLIISAYDGSKITMKDFLKDPEVLADPNVPGQYVIAGGIYPEPTTPFHIFYQQTDDYFGITLYGEPLSQSRVHAEDLLMEKLDIGKEDMCKLSYVVAPGPGVGEVYQGQNLGFSFCQGAVILP